LTDQLDSIWMKHQPRKW